MRDFSKKFFWDVKMINKIFELIKKYREMISYLFFGVATTAVNFAVYALMTDLLSISETPSNVTAWFAAVIFAFVTNKLFVFESKSLSPARLVREFGAFFAARVFSGIIENGGFWICVDLLEINDWVVKIALSVIVVITNYITGKFIVFRKKRAEKNESDKVEK